MQSVHAIGNEVCTLTRGVLNTKRCHRLIVVAQLIEPAGDSRRELGAAQFREPLNLPCTENGDDPRKNRLVIPCPRR